MKKRITVKTQKQAKGKTSQTQLKKLAAQQRLTIGLDLGDRQSRYCILNAAGEVISKGSLPTTQTGLNTLFEKMPSSRVALEVGTHSPWVSRQLAQLGHEVIVANPRQVALIGRSTRKDDWIDAEKLARLARVDPHLLYPIRHRGEEAQADLAVLRARAALVEIRPRLINTARGLAKPMGERLKDCDSEAVGPELAKDLSAPVQAVLGPMLQSIAQISEQIHAYDEKIHEMVGRYPEVDWLQPVYGVGELISLAFVLTIEDPNRFAHSREVGPFLGLVPKQRQSSQSAPELRISKEGDRLLRSLLVQGAHCILRRGAPDSDLRRWALAKLQGSDAAGARPEPKGKKKKNRKKQIVIAVARKLAVLLHRLWATGEVYEPLYKTRRAVSVAA